MSADVTSREDLDDAAFRALLEPLASEVLPGRKPPSPNVSPDLRRLKPELPPEERPQPPAVDSEGANAAEQANLDGDVPPPAGTPDAPARGAAPIVSGALPAAELPQPAALEARAGHGPTLSGAALAGAALADEARSAPDMPSDRGLAAYSAAVHHAVTPAQQMLPEALSPPAVVTSHPAVLGSQRQSEAASSLPESVRDRPNRSATGEQPEDHPPAASDHFAASPSGMLPEGRWRLTVSLPIQHAASQPFADWTAPQSTALAVRPAVWTAGPSAYRPLATVVPPAATRPVAGPRLIARAGAVRQTEVLPGSATQLVMRRPVLPRARVRWRVVLLAGLASAVTVACLSWLFSAPEPVDAPIGMAGASQMADAPQAGAGSAAQTAPVAGSAGTAGSQNDPAAGSATSPASRAAQIARTGQEPDPATSPAPTQDAVPEPAPAGELTATSGLGATPPQAMIGLLTQRGDAALAEGDIIAARLLYEHAAALGSATAATAAGKTYDLDFLLRADTHGIRPDPAAAATWYRKAVALGDPSARSLLAHMEARSRQ